MSSFQISSTPTKRTAGRFVTRVRRELQKALAEENQKRGLTQSDLARTIGVHRSVINRELRGFKDITLGRVAELAHAMGRKPLFSVPEASPQSGSNLRPRTTDNPRADVATGKIELPTPDIEISSKAA